MSSRTRSRWASRFPAGYLVMGDALASFNPIYAQGMSVAALEARALDECLAQGEGKLAARFFKLASKIIDIPWNTAVGNDLRFPEIEGPRTAMTKFINWYVEKLHHAAHHDADVSVAFLKVVNLLAPPPSIMHPRMMWRVWRGNMRRPQGEERRPGHRCHDHPTAAGRLRVSFQGQSRLPSSCRC